MEKPTESIGELSRRVTSLHACTERAIDHYYSPHSVKWTETWADRKRIAESAGTEVSVADLNSALFHIESTRQALVDLRRAIKYTIGVKSQIAAFNAKRDALVAEAAATKKFNMECAKGEWKMGRGWAWINEDDAAITEDDALAADARKRLKA